MHSSVMEEIARYRARDLRSTAARHSLFRELRRRRDRSIRHRIGWALVGVGLALACGASDA